MNINDRIYDLLEMICSIKKDEPLSAYTTYKTGGPADYLIEPPSFLALREALNLLRAENVPVVFIGGGSNLLVSDDGIRGAVVRISRENSFSDDLVRVEDGMVYAEAGTAKRDFIEFCIDNGFGGVGFMAGIPGTIGGGIAMNAGTNMGSFSDVLRAIDYIGSDSQFSRLDVTADMCTYRNFSLPEDSVITGGLFLLPVEDDSEALRKRIVDINAERRIKHPLDYPSAGSVFKNPEGYSSWQLVDNAGLKGMNVGGARVSEKHTNFIINTGGATSSDIRELISLIQERVFDRAGVRLETEIRMLGF